MGMSRPKTYRHGRNRRMVGELFRLRAAVGFARERRRIDAHPAVVETASRVFREIVEPCSAKETGPRVEAEGQLAFQSVGPIGPQ